MAYLFLVFVIFGLSTNLASCVCYESQTISILYTNQHAWYIWWNATTVLPKKTDIIMVLHNFVLWCESIDNLM